MLRLVPGPTGSDGLRQFFAWDSGIQVEDVALRGGYPTTVLVITFHHRSEPECRYAWHGFLWTHSIDAPVVSPQLEDVWTHFYEFLGTRSPHRRRPCQNAPVPLGTREAIQSAQITPR
jgi:hypothetical protein